MEDEPKNILVWADVPPALRKGDEVDLLITVKNAREEEEFEMESLDIGDGFLEGFKLEDIEPSPDDRDHSEGSLTLVYDRVFDPGETAKFRVRLKAKKPGVYIGEVDVWDADDSDELQCVSRHAQTEIDEF